LWNNVILPIINDNLRNILGNERCGMNHFFKELEILKFSFRGRNS